MTTSVPVEYPDAVWIGAIDESVLRAHRVRLQRAEGYRRARLLVRRDRFVRGFVEVAVDNGLVDGAALRERVAALPAAVVSSTSPRPPISVVVCTYDRPEMLRTVLRSIGQLEYPDYEIVVVDNAPHTGSVKRVVADLPDSPIRVVAEPRRGISRARNRALLEATHEIVAFADDDVSVDRYWLQGIADGFGAGPAVACVTGAVPTGALVSDAQHYFDRRVRWASNTKAELFSLRSPRPDEPLFPFEIGRFGTGANFAVRRRDCIALGGFDEGLVGGEEIDVFVRLLLAGRDLVHEPNAVVWHRHRTDRASLAAQLDNYGRALGAWATKLLLSPRTLPMVLRRVAPALRQLRSSTAPDVVDLPQFADAKLDGVERRAVLGGPWAFARGRLGGAARPLRGADVPDLPTLPGDATLPSWAMLGAAFGLLSAISVIPSPLRAALLLAFVALGPGAAALAFWEVELAPSVLRALVPVTGLAVVITTLSFGLFVNLWSPRLTLVGLAVATATAALATRRVLARRATV